MNICPRVRDESSTFFNDFPGSYKFLNTIKNTHRTAFFPPHCRAPYCHIAEMEENALFNILTSSGLEILNLLSCNVKCNPTEEVLII